MSQLYRFVSSRKSYLGPDLQILPQAFDLPLIPANFITLLNSTSGQSPQWPALSLIDQAKESNTYINLLVELGLYGFQGREQEINDILYNLPVSWDPILANEITKIPREQLLQYLPGYSYSEIIMCYVIGYRPELFQALPNSDHVFQYSGSEIAYLANFYGESILSEGYRIYHTYIVPTNL